MWGFLFCFLSFETGSLYVIQAGLEFTIYPKLALTLKQSACLHLLSAGITGMHCHTQQDSATLYVQNQYSSIYLCYTFKNTV